MNTKNSFIVILLFVIIIVLIELIFNFRKRLMENFYESVERPKSIISKMDGKIFNIFFNNHIMYINSPTNLETKLIGLNDDGKLINFEKNTDENKTQWELIEIKNRSDYIRELGNNNNNGYNTNSSCTNYPFYIVKSRNTNFSGNNTRCLQFNYGKLMARPIGNYDTQKWDVSSLATKYGTGHGTQDNPDICYKECEVEQSFKSDTSKPSEPNEKIKINFNIKDEFLKQLFPNGIDSHNQSQSNSNSNGNLVPNSAIGSVCRGCNFDN